MHHRRLVEVFVQHSTSWSILESYLVITPLVNLQKAPIKSCAFARGPLQQVYTITMAFRLSDSGFCFVQDSNAMFEENQTHANRHLRHLSEDAVLVPCQRA